jgi:hypothetical protein
LRAGNPIRFFLACTQVCPLGGCLGILQHLLQLLDLTLDIARAFGSGLFVAGGRNRLQDAEFADQPLLFGPQILDAL